MRLSTKGKTKYFQSNLLKEHNFHHAFFTKRCNKNTPIDLQIELNLTSNIHHLKQFHSNKIIQVDNESIPKSKPGDCLITKEKNQSLWIYTADCIPILIADKETRNIAACHSGLKGLKNQIISKTIKRLKEIGSKKNNLIVAFGPSITGNNYQVDKKDINDILIDIIGEKYTNQSFHIVKLNKEMLITLFRKNMKPEKLLFDIQAAAMLQLEKEGIKRSQIDVGRICTYENQKLLNSYRRDRSYLRQWNCIYS